MKEQKQQFKFTKYFFLSFILTSPPVEMATETNPRTSTAPQTVKMALPQEFSGKGNN